MKRATLPILTGLLILGIGVGCQAESGIDKLPTGPEQVRPLEVGAPAPDVELSTIDGKRFQLASLVGNKPLVLIFYRGGW